MNNMAGINLDMNESLCVIHIVYWILAPNLTQIYFVRLVRIHQLTKIDTFVTTDAIICNKETWFGRKAHCVCCYCVL